LPSTGPIDRAMRRGRRALTVRFRMCFILHLGLMLALMILR